MEWIKTKYDRFLLILAAVALLGVAGFLIMQSLSFAAQFELRPSSGKAKLPETDLKSIEEAKARLNAPQKWVPSEESGLLLRSRPYLEISGVLIDPTLPESPDIHPPVKNLWLIKNSLPIRETDVLTQDPDEDGFTNLEEYQSTGGSTDPNNAASHPDFADKLFLAGIKANPFFLRFSAVTQPARIRDGKTIKAVFQIDATNSREPTQFLSLDDTIIGSDFKLTEFKEVLIKLPNGTDDDKSELTIVNPKESVVLVLKQNKNVGKNDAIFTFRWKGEEQFARRLDQTFTLKPDPKTEYQVKEIADDQVKIIRLSDSKEYVIKKP